MIIRPDVTLVVKLAMKGIGLEPFKETADKIGYELRFESGLHLVLLIVAGERKGWFRPQPQLHLIVADARNPDPVPKALASEQWDCPKGLDPIYGAAIMSRLNHMARSIAVSGWLGSAFQLAGKGPQWR